MDYPFMNPMLSKPLIISHERMDDLYLHGKTNEIIVVVQNN